MSIERFISIAGFALVGLGALVVYLIGERRPDKFTPLPTLLDRIMDDRPARVTIMLFWWWVGWHFFVTPPIL